MEVPRFHDECELVTHGVGCIVGNGGATAGKILDVRTLLQATKSTYSNRIA
jgi:hypothetical protein